MKKINTFVILIFISFACFICTSCTNKDIKLIEQYFENYFSRVEAVDTLIHTEESEKYLTSYVVPNIKKDYKARITYSGNNDIMVVKKDDSNYLYVSFDALSSEPTEITLNVKVNLDSFFDDTFNVKDYSIYEMNFKKTFSYGSYISYFGNILADYANISYDHITNKDNLTIIAKSYIRDGHFHTNYVYQMDFNKNTFEYHRVEYEKIVGSSYNHKRYEAIYYFDQNNPRIEGLNSGTYYIGQGEFTSTDSTDKEVYQYCKKINEIFKKYSDNRYIQNLDL